MVDKKYFKKIAKEVFKHSKGVKSPSLIHPKREWLTGLVIAIVIFLGSSAWSANIYFHHKDISISDSQLSATDKVVYRESLVDSALERLAEKKDRYDNLTSQTYVPAPEPEPISEVEAESEPDPETEDEVEPIVIETEDGSFEEVSPEEGELLDDESLILEVE